MSAARTQRRALGVWFVAGTAMLVLLASTGVLGTSPALAVRQTGHWVYDRTLGKVLHVDGGSKDVDSSVAVAGVGPANQVVQDDRNGYVIDQTNGRIIVFGKSTLKVQSTVPLSSTEEPVVLEAVGGPYLVYRHGGRVVRLGPKPATIRVGGQLTSPVATTDGTVWLQRNSARLCRIVRGSTKVSCLVGAPAGRAGTLATVHDAPAYINRSAGTIALVTPTGIGAQTKIAAPNVLATGKISGTDAGGRLPVLTTNPMTNTTSLVLLDTSRVGDTSTATSPVTVPLGTGRFDTPVTGGDAVVLVDRTTHQVLTFDRQGQRQAAVATPTAAGTVRASRGQDGRVYVDDPGGAQTLVVDGDGKVTPVSIGGDSTGKRAKPTGTNTAPVTTTPVPTSPVTPDPVLPPIVTPNPVTVPPAPTPRTSQQHAQPRNTIRHRTHAAKINAQHNGAAPDAPATVTALAGPGHIDVSWFAPASTDSPITGYQVTWTAATSGGVAHHRTLAPGALRTRLTGLTSGTRYTVSVAARNASGLGPATSSAPVVAKPLQPGPLAPKAVAAAGGSVTVTWSDEPGTWTFTVSTTTGRQVARTSATQAVVENLPVGVRVGFTVRGTEAAGGTVSGSTAQVTPFRLPSTPRSLVGSVVGDNANVKLTWSAPSDLGGGSPAGYRVVVHGGGVTDTTGTSTQVAASPSGDTVVDLFALTKNPNGGSTLVSGKVTRTVHYSAPKPDVHLNNGEVKNGHLILDFTLDTHGVPATCRLVREDDNKVIFGPTATSSGSHNNYDAGPYTVTGSKDTVRMFCTTYGGTGDDPTIVSD